MKNIKFWRLELDIEQAAESMKRLLSLNASAYYCYHGGILSSSVR